LGIGLNERYEPIARVMYYSTDALLASVLAMPVVVLENDHRLFLTFTRMFNITSVKVALITVISANWADPLLFGQQLSPKTLPFAGVHQQHSF